MIVAFFKTKMKFSFFNSVLLSVLILIAKPSLGQSKIPVSNLSGFYRSGQVFLTWSEIATPAKTHFNVYLYSKPITKCNLHLATKVGHHIEAFSACDWWANPKSFDKTAIENRSKGFVIEPGKSLDPNSGLFVHTITAKDPKKIYFAVTSVLNQEENTTIISADNSLKTPIEGEIAQPSPISLKSGPEKGSAVGGSLTIKLHGRGGDVALSPNSNFIVFGDSTQGWREGLAHKFLVYKRRNDIVIEPYDRLWIGRPLLYSWDDRDHVPAINTWWYGSNNQIYDETLSKTGVVVNYTEKYLVYLAKWGQQYFGTDPNKTFIQGNSMGATGAISTGLHNPDVFSTIFSTVPLPAYTRRKGADQKTNIERLDGLCGRFCDETVMTNEGISVLDRMNSEKVVAESKKNLPFIVLMNGRTDGSMPWVNNPSFYRQLDQSKRGYAVYWNNGGHNMSSSAPSDILNFYSLHPAFALNKSYPAFSDFSENKNPGNGEKEDGDIEGWMNRGLHWDNVIDTTDSWSADIYIKDILVVFPATVSLTPCNLQNFHINKGEVLKVQWQNKTQKVKVSENGRVTVSNLMINSSNDKVNIKIYKKN